MKLLPLCSSHNRPVIPLTSQETWITLKNNAPVAFAFTLAGKLFDMPREFHLLSPDGECLPALIRFAEITRLADGWVTLLTLEVTPINTSASTTSLEMECAA